MVDAIVLQETKLTDDKFPHAEIETAGYRAQWFGQRTNGNGAAAQPRQSVEVVRNIPGFPTTSRYARDRRQHRGLRDRRLLPNGQAPDS